MRADKLRGLSILLILRTMLLSSMQVRAKEPEESNNSSGISVVRIFLKNDTMAYLCIRQL